MKRVYLILGDQLSEEHPFLKRKDWSSGEQLLMIESIPRAEWLPYHPQKLLYVFTCMRRFALHVQEHFPHILFSYVKECQQSFTDVINSLESDEVHVVEPAEPRARVWLEKGLKARLVVHASPFFLADDSMLPQKPPYLLENFYRKMRTKNDILMDNGEPVGGQWNFDKDNRRPPDKDLLRRLPSEFFSEEWLDELDRRIYADVEKMLKRFIPADRFGDWKCPEIPTHRASARRFLDVFMRTKLADFGPYEDAMVEESVGLYHSGLSAMMNNQILSVKEIVDAAERAPASVPLSSREGFIRQVIGWREFIRLIYLRHAADYSKSNFFGFDAKLPDVYWGAKSGLRCLSTIVRQVREHAYSHHIPRLMVLGNFALLTRTDPHEVNRWFWSVYLDAYEWVVSPNVLGMSQFADGGVFATKPYVSGANYVSKMSNFCKSCRFDPKQTLGENACPFNSLYWDFIDDTQRLKVSRPSFARRMGMMWSVWNKKTDDEKKAIKAQAEKYRQLVRAGQL